MKILISGSTGFLGSNLLKILTARGHDVIGFGSKDVDLRFSNRLDIYNHINFDRIIHLAAWTQAGDFCISHPGEQWLINQQINTNVLNWWKTNQPEAKLISIGTSCSYDESLPHKEENYLIGSPRTELYTYAMTKRMLLIGQRALNKQFGLNYLTVVPSTLFGPFYHLENKQPHFIFDLIMKIINYKEMKKQVILWGDGYQRRELVFVDDFIEIMLSLDKIAVNDVYNIGAGKDYSIRDFACMICEILNIDGIKIQYDENGYVGAKTKFLDNTKLETILQGPQKNLLRKHLETTIDWIYSKFLSKKTILT